MCMACPERVILPVDLFTPASCRSSPATLSPQLYSLSMIMEWNAHHTSIHVSFLLLHFGCWRIQYCKKRACPADQYDQTVVSGAQGRYRHSGQGRSRYCMVLSRSLSSQEHHPLPRALRNPILLSLQQLHCCFDMIRVCEIFFEPILAHIIGVH